MAAFLGFALAGCSDDVIDVNNQEQQVSNEPAYLSVSFSTSSTSSRSTADDANNNGDGHNKDGEAGQEHSGHINAGSTNENAITQILLVVKHTGEAAGFAKLYDAPENGFASVSHNNETCYQIEKEIELSSSKLAYEVLVVANPYEALYSSYSTQLQAEDGVKDAAIVNSLYQAILTGQTPKVDTDEIGGNWNNFATNIVQVDTKSETPALETPALKCIMMANKEKCSVVLDSPYDKEIADVTIERVASKITFRETYTDNKYTVEVPDLTSVKIKQFTINNESYNVGTITTTEGDDENKKEVVTTYYVKLDAEDNITSLYKAVESSDANTSGYEEVKEHQFTKSDFKWAYEAGQYNTKKWTVKLEKYALVNLSKQVYNVRHTIAENSVAVPFGKLTGANFLYTPNWETTFNGGINNVSFTNGEFKAGFSTSPWFYNTLANVSVDSKAEAKIYFSDLKSSGWSDVDDKQDVEADNQYHNPAEGENQASNDPIGYLLAYCLENTTDIEHQTHGLSTGITFMGKIYDENGEDIQRLYRYNGYFFENIDAIKDAYDIADDDEDWKDIEKDEDDVEKLAAVGVVKYDSNTCYYYTTEIKHFDNSLPLTLGYMEFAIMRNNIYSLSVSGINIIGDPWVDPIPSTPDEVEKPKLEVHAQIEPWIVRYHDIEFN